MGPRVVPESLSGSVKYWVSLQCCNRGSGNPLSSLEQAGYTGILHRRSVLETEEWSRFGMLSVFELRRMETRNQLSRGAFSHDNLISGW